MHALLELAQSAISHDGDEEGIVLAGSHCALAMAGAHASRLFVLEDGVLWRRRREHMAQAAFGKTIRKMWVWIQNWILGSGS